MKRLKAKLLGMEPDTATYTAMYEGTMHVVPPNSMPSWTDHDPTYYSGDVGFSISGTDMLAQDKPTVEIRIPVDMLIPADFSLT